MLVMAVSFVLLIFFALPMRVAAASPIGFSQIKTRGTAAGDEFIELFNPSDAVVDINGYKLVKQTASGTTYTVTTFGNQPILPNSFLLMALEGSSFANQADTVYKTAIADNNSLSLFDASGLIADQLAWGDGKTLTNHAADQSYQRNWQLSGAAWTAWTVEPFVSAHRSGDQLMQEVIPSPAPMIEIPAVHINESQLVVVDGDKPWIELVFEADTNVTDLVAMVDEQNVATVSGNFFRGQHIVLFADHDFNTASHTVRLRLEHGVEFLSLTYPEQSSALVSYARRDDGSWAWTATDTAGRPNVFSDLPMAPVCERTAINPPAEPTNTEPAPTSPPPPVVRNNGRVFINEVFANPGGDEASGEFIELINEEAERISLAGWTIADAAKKTILGDIAIEANGYLVLHRIQTNLSLNNTTETVSLTDASGQLISSFSFEAAAEDMSWNRAEPWYEASPTPGTSNVLLRSPEPQQTQESPTVLPEQQTEAALPPVEPPPTTPIQAEIAVGEKTVATSTAKTAPTKAINAPTAKTTSFQTWPQVKGNARVTIVGVVVAPPGLFGEKSATIQDVTGAYRGIELYFSAADWPALDTGDIVSVSGKKSTAKSGDRLLISTASDIEMLDHMDMDATSISSNQITDKHHRTIIGIEGRIIEAKNGILTVSDAFGEWRVSAKKASLELDLGTLPVEATISGLYIAAKTPEVWLRTADDIELTQTEETPPPVTNPTEPTPLTTIAPVIGKTDSPWLAPLAAAGSAGGLSWYFFQDALRQHGLRLIEKLRK